MSQSLLVQVGNCTVSRKLCWILHGGAHSPQHPPPPSVEAVITQLKSSGVFENPACHPCLCTFPFSAKKWTSSPTYWHSTKLKSQVISHTSPFSTNTNVPGDTWTILDVTLGAHLKLQVWRSDLFHPDPWLGFLIVLKTWHCLEKVMTSS